MNDSQRERGRERGRLGGVAAIQVNVQPEHSSHLLFSPPAFPALVSNSAVIDGTQSHTSILPRSDDNALQTSFKLLLKKKKRATCAHLPRFSRDDEDFPIRSGGKKPSTESVITRPSENQKSFLFALWNQPPCCIKCNGRQEKRQGWCNLRSKWDKVRDQIRKIAGAKEPSWNRKVHQGSAGTSESVLQIITTARERKKKKPRLKWNDPEWLRPLPPFLTFHSRLQISVELGVFPHSFLRHFGGVWQTH